MVTFQPISPEFWIQPVNVTFEWTPYNFQRMVPTLTIHYAAIVLLTYYKVVRAYINPPSDTCTACCCCVVTSAGTRNFCPENGGGEQENSIPNCYYLQTHESDVLNNWDAPGNAGIYDTYTIPGTGLWWNPTDPAYGCFKDLATVTASDSATSLPTSALPENTQNSNGKTYFFIFKRC